MELREQIKNCDDGAGKLEKVEVPEWNCDIYVKRLNGLERDALEQAFANASESDEEVSARAFYVAHFSCDSEGNRIFDDNDVSWLAEKYGTALERIGKVARDLNGLTSESVDDAEKNS